jgi:hypothetical protein
MTRCSYDKSVVTSRGCVEAKVDGELPLYEAASTLLERLNTMTFKSEAGMLNPWSPVASIGPSLHFNTCRRRVYGTVVVAPVFQVTTIRRIYGRRPARWHH